MTHHDPNDPTKCNSEMINPSLPFVSIVIPMWNEARHIEVCIDSILSQDYPQDRFEIIVVDGGSTDGSVEIVQALAQEHSNIYLLGGPGTNCPAAMNIGIGEASGNIVSKVDAHGYIEPDFLRRNVEYLVSDNKIMCSGGPIRYLADTSFCKATGYARSSIFGVGPGSVYLTGKQVQSVNNVQCGTYKKEVFDEVGLFDGSLQFGEDEELNWRIVKAGYKILSSPAVKFCYYPRNSWRSLFRQYYNYGFARAKVIAKHPDFFRLKHPIPFVFVFSLVGAALLSLFMPPAILLFGLIVVLYISLLLIFSTLIASREGWRYLVILPWVFAALHFGYGAGFGVGLAVLIRQRTSN